MRKSMWIIVLAVAVAGAFGGFLTAAEAVTWDRSGDTSFTATGGAMSFGIPGLGNWPCRNSSTVIGQAGAATYIGNVYPAIHATLNYTGCSAGPGTNFNLTCQVTVTGVTQTAGITNGSMDTTCSYGPSSPVYEVCHVSGSTPVTYYNPAGPLGGILTFQTSTSLVMTNGVGYGPGTGSSTCLFGNGIAMTFSEQTFRIVTATGGPSAPHSGPSFIRTP